MPADSVRDPGAAPHAHVPRHRDPVAPDPLVGPRRRDLARQRRSAPARPRPAVLGSAHGGRGAGRSSSSTVTVGWSAADLRARPRRLHRAPGRADARPSCARSGATVSGCVDSGLTAATSYSYTVEAQPRSWSSVPAGPVSATTPLSRPVPGCRSAARTPPGTAFTATITATTDGTTVDTVVLGDQGWSPSSARTRARRVRHRATPHPCRSRPVWAPRRSPCTRPSR